jgi:two-component system, sensor histidine kinase and response regulator
MTPLKVLLAEDNTVNQMLALALLRRRDAVVTVANNGREAVERWSEGAFDLILMDIQMPEMDGLEATRMIRSREPSGHRIPIIAFTARAMTGDREQCMAAGMDSYLSKPIRSAELMEIIEKIVAASNPEAVGGQAAELERPFDLEKLLGIVSGDESLVVELVSLFTGEAPTYVDAICQAHAARDRQTLRNAAHTLKGSAAAITARAVAQGLPSASKSVHGRRRSNRSSPPSPTCSWRWCSSRPSSTSSAS